MKIFEISLFGLEIGPSYYGLMYALGMIGGFYIIKKRQVVSKMLLDNLLFYIFIGIILGGRLGYVLFYNFNYYIDNLPDVLKVWEGGMSFHGGTIGVIIAMILFSKIYKFPFYKLADEVTLVIPIGLFFGRIGNYINKELLGYSGYTGPLSVELNGINYFPSPLLEALLEGLILFILLYIVSKYQKFKGQIASVFLIGYGVFRIFVEIFFREPDLHIGLLFGSLSLGTLLSVPMIVSGVGFYIYLSKNNAISK